MILEEVLFAALVWRCEELDGFYWGRREGEVLVLFIDFLNAFGCI